MDKPFLVLGPLIAKGRSAEVYAWNEKQVLKLFYTWCSPNLVQREMENARVVASKDLPTPKVIGSQEVNGRQGIIYERVDGPSMLTVLSTKPWRLFRLARQLAELHSDMHKQDGNGLRSLHSSLKESIEQVENLPSPLKSGVLEVLNTLPDGSALCHCDFHPDQVLITPAGSVIVDWMTAHQGNPLADVARTCILLTIGQIPDASRVMRALVHLARRFLYRSYITRYLELNPAVTQEQVRTWMIPVAAGRLEEGIAGEREALLNLVQSYLTEEHGVETHG